MRLLRFVVLILTLLVLHAPSAFADPITFTHQGIGSGSIGGTPFSNTAFIITAVGNTSNRQSFGGGFFINHDSVTISITGVGTFAFTTGTRTFVNNSVQIVGFSRAGPGFDLFNGPSNLLFAAWDMLSPIGPVAGNGQLLQWGPLDSAIFTNGGQLLFNDSVNPGIFTASLGQPDAIPEPASLTLLGIGFGGAAIARRFRRRKQFLGRAG